MACYVTVSARLGMPGHVPKRGDVLHGGYMSLDVAGPLAQIQAALLERRVMSTGADKRSYRRSSGFLLEPGL
jgi:hypothetical protein